MNPTEVLLEEEIEGYKEMLTSFFGDEDLLQGEALEAMFTEIAQGNEDLREVTVLFARTRVTAIRQEMRRHSNSFYSASQFHSFLVRYLFYKMLHAYSVRFDTRNEVPLDHHWLSRCYIKRFATFSEKAMEFSVIEASGKRKTLGEDFFVHSRTQNGQGHFSLALEHFFGLIEADYAQSMEGGKFGTIEKPEGDNLTRLVMACYYVISQVRVPKKDVRVSQLLREAWGELDRMDYSQSIFDTVEGVREFMNVSTVEVPFELTIAPMVPVYTRQAETGVKMRLFPIAKDRMVVFSETPDLDGFAEEVEMYNHQVSDKAKGLGTFVIV